MNPSDRENDLSVARALTWRYAIALALVATLSTAAWLSLHLVISEQESTAAVVNVSGRQRMLSQRTALFSNLLVTVPQAERSLIRSKLKEAIYLMNRSHSGLTRGDEEMGLPATMSPAVHAMYFDGTDALDPRVTAYIAAVRALLTEPDAALTPDNPWLRFITTTAPGALVASLDAMVRQYQQEGEASVTRLQRAETAFWLITLLLLALEAALIFHPFVRHVRGIIGKLRATTEELQLHRDHLEDLVHLRTVELDEKNKALAESEEMFRFISTYAQDAIIILGPGEQITYWNPAAEHIFGYPADEALGRNLHELLTPPHYRETAHAQFADFCESGTGTLIGKTFEITALRKNGEEFPVELSISTFRLQGNWHALGLIRDITDRRLAETALRQQKQLSDDIINSLPGVFYMLDTEGRFVRVNQNFLELTGYTSEELAQMTVLDLFAEKDKGMIAQRIGTVFEIGTAWAEAELVTKSGAVIPYYFTGHRILVGGKPHLIGLGTDITERKRAEENLRITASVFDNSQEAILITDADNRITDVNLAFSRITGYGREEVLGKNPKLLNSNRQEPAYYTAMWQALKQDGSWRGEIWNRRKSGEVYAEMLSVSAIRDDAGKVLRYVGVFSDISHLKEHEAELSRVAYYDALTGIPNRALLADRMKQAIAQTSREGGMMAVCYIDLDGFKQINDTLGHEAGDQVLIEVSKRIGVTIRGGDTVARLGGDEFVVVLLGLERGGECVTTLERLLAAIAQPINVKDRIGEVSASIGVSIYPLDDEAPDTLLRHADQAMYVAKQSGKDRYFIYDPALDLRARGQYEFLKSVRLAMQNNQFELYYQPKVDLRSKQMVGAEALIRWRHPERGLLVPAEFLHDIENTELDIELGDWVIATALAHIEHWRQAGLDIEVSVNVSAHHLESHHFAEKLQQQFALYPDMPPGRFQIEVLETAALNDFAIVRKIIETCSNLGVRFALDDFGTGYSSLSYLSHLPVDVLKIDQSFVHHMLEDKGDNAIIKGVLAMAQAFNRQTVVEGIENEEQYRALLDMGCEIGQGYAIARPMPADELVNWKAG